MRPFEFKVDTSTPLMEVIHAGTFLVMIFSLGTVVYAALREEPFEWGISLLIVAGSLVFGLRPYVSSQYYLILNEEGVYQHNNFFQMRHNRLIPWDWIKSIKVQKHALSITYHIGATERVKMPIHTSQQVRDLKAYLKQLTQLKEVEYLES